MYFVIDVYFVIVVILLLLCTCTDKNVLFSTPGNEATHVHVLASSTSAGLSHAHHFRRNHDTTREIRCFQSRSVAIISMIIRLEHGVGA